MAKLYVHNNNIEERKVDPITGIKRENFFLESYINTYKLISEYMQEFKASKQEDLHTLMSYLWTPDGFKYEKAEDVITFYKNKKII